MIFQQLHDPDYYYHLALTKQIAENGFASTLPQASGIGWDILYTDKEFLFHMLTALFYKIGGEAGVRLLMPLLFLFTVGSFLYFAYFSLRFFFNKSDSLKWACIAFIPIFADPHFVARMNMVRPHVFAVLIFVWLAIFIIQNRAHWAFATGVIFSLAYHGIQVPLLLLVCAGIASRLTRENHFKAIGMALGGLTLGVIVNPYFPGNLVIIELVTRIIFKVGTKVDLNYGLEVYPWTSSIFIKTNFLILVTLAGSVLLYLQVKTAKQRFPILFAILLTLTFLTLSAISPRAREYLVPSGIFLFILLAKFLIETRRETLKIDFLIVAVSSLMQIGFVFSHYQQILPSEPKDLKNYREGLKQIEETGKHVFNCNWSSSPFIFYFRPDLSFIDILDPSFLDRYSPLHSKIRTEINLGREIDAYQWIQTAFKSQYVLCEAPQLNLLLERDPRLERIYPKTLSDKYFSQYMVRIYKLKESTNYFVKNYDYHQVTIHKVSEMPRLSRDSVHEWSPRPEGPEGKSDYFDFRRSLPLKISENMESAATPSQDSKIECVWLKPAADELIKKEGAQFIGLGGGPNIRVWLNGKKWFQSRGEEPFSKPIDVLVPIPHLKKNDDLTILVCPGLATEQFGLAMSFWKADEIDKICEDRNSDLLVKNTITSQWRYWGTDEKTCLAPIAGTQYNFSN